MKSNEALLTIRQKIISLFKQYEYIFLPVLRFVLCFGALKLLKNVTGYTGMLSGMLVLTGFSIMGAFVSAEWIIILSILISTVFISSTSPILGLMLFIVMCLGYFLFARLFPGESILIIAVLIAFYMKMEMLVPIVAALFGTYISIAAILIGTVLWFTVPSLKVILPAALDKSEIIDTVTALTVIDYKNIFLEPQMMVTIVIFFIVFTTIYIIRKQSIDYAPYIAIGVGAVMNILGFGLARIFFDTLSINISMIVFQTLLFSMAATVMQFLSIVLDYQRAENVTFEDEDNYYYVKIVPKIQLKHKHKTVKKIYTDVSQTGEIEAVNAEAETAEDGKVKSDLKV